MFVLEMAPLVPGVGGESLSVRIPRFSIGLSSFSWLEVVYVYVLCFHCVLNS